MISHEDNSLQFPEESWMEAFLESVKCGNDALVQQIIPVVGPLFSYFLGKKIDTLRQERFRECFLQLFQYIRNIQQDIINSSEFRDALMAAFSHYANEPSEKKRKFIINLNRSLCIQAANSSSDTQFDIFFIFNELFDQLSLPAIDCLVHFQDKFGLSATRYDIVEYFRSLHGIHGKRAFIELVNNSLLEGEYDNEMPPKFTFSSSTEQSRLIKQDEKPKGQVIYKIQPLGAIFSDWLKSEFKE